MILPFIDTVHNLVESNVTNGTGGIKSKGSCRDTADKDSMGASTASVAVHSNVYVAHTIVTAQLLFELLLV